MSWGQDDLQTIKLEHKGMNSMYVCVYINVVFCREMS